MGLAPTTSGVCGPHEAHHKWEGPHKEFLKGALKRPGSTSWGQWISAREASTR